MPEYTERFNDLCHDLEQVFGESAYWEQGLAVWFRKNQGAIADVIMNHGLGGFIYKHKIEPIKEETNMSFKYETKHFIDDVCIEEMSEKQLLMKIEAVEEEWNRVFKIKGDEESEGLDKMMTDTLEIKEKLLKHLDKKVLKDSQA